jgi:hypothetical protein
MSMKVKVYGHSQGFDHCKGGNRVQNAQVKTVVTTRHNGTKFSGPKANCRWCKRWVCFDIVSKS